MKKLQDEVVPALQYVRLTKATGEILFRLDDGYPDFWVRKNAAARPQGVEVTLAQGREQQALGEELNKKRIAPGSLGLPDDAPSHVFRSRLDRSRIMRNPDAALKAFSGGIKASLNKKRKPKYVSFDLIIGAPLNSHLRKHLTALESELRVAADRMPFREIYVIGTQSSDAFGFQIK